MDISGISGINYSAEVFNENKFKNIDRAIQVYGTHTQTEAFHIGKYNTVPNSFHDNDVHIYASLGHDINTLEIKNNEFFDGRYGVWIEGDADYLVKKNRFFNHTIAGVVSWQTGEDYSNVQCNQFIEQAWGIVAVGKNSHTKFLGNDFLSTSNYDIEVLQSLEGELGQIDFYQGEASKIAKNCFEIEPNDDIKAIPNSTAPFIYFIPQGGQEACYIPDNNEGNNYMLFLAFSGEVDYCIEDLDDEFEEVPPTKIDLINAKNTESQLSIIWQNDVANHTNGIAYEEAAYNKERILYYLLNEAVKNEDYEEVELLLNDENTVKAQKMLFGLKLKEGDYTAAQNILNALPINTVDEQNFVVIQQLNLQRLNTGISFTLSEAEELQLQGIAESELASRAYARSLLYVLTGQQFPLNLYLEGGDKSLHIKKGETKGNTSPFKLFPNPANKSVKLDYPIHKNNQELLLKVFDLNGKVLTSIILDNSGAYLLDTSNLPEGVFVLHISNGKEVVFQTKLVLIH